MNPRRGLVLAAALAWSAGAWSSARAAELGSPGTWDGSFGAGYAFPFGGNSRNLDGSFAFDFAAEYQSSARTAVGLEMGNDTSFVGRDGNDSLSVVSVTPTLKWGRSYAAGGGTRLRPYAIVGAGFYSVERVSYSSASGGGSFPGGATVPVSEFGFNVGVGVDWQLGPNLLASLDARFHDLIFSHGGLQMATPSLKLSYLFGSAPRGDIRNRPIE